MSTRWTRLAALPFAAITFASCTDGVGPGGDQNLSDVILDFCASATPTFVAFMNDGGAWTRATQDNNGAFTVRAGDQTTLAIVQQAGTSYSTEYIYTTAEELQPLNGISCTEDLGTKTLNGSVAGVTAGSAAMVTMGSDFAFVVPPPSTFTLSDLANGPIDVIAHRELLTLTGAVPNAVIIRRAQDRTSGSFIPVLDFNVTSEALSPAQHTLTIGGLSGSEDNYLFLEFSTPTTPAHLLYATSLFTSSTQTIYGIPSTLTQSNDLHSLDVYGEATDGSYRGQSQYYRNSADRTLTLGPSLNTPTITTAATTPYTRLRAQLPSQAEYDQFVSVYYIQDETSSIREVVVTGSVGYFGGRPSTWDLVIPAGLNEVSGFPLASQLQTGETVDWYVDAYGGSTISNFYGSPTDGAVLRYAGRTSFVALAQRSVAVGERRRHPSPLKGRRIFGAL
jgi:hypothetical protein